MNRLYPADIIAILLILGYLILSFLGRTNDLNATILVIVGFYFGREHLKDGKDS